MPLITPLLRQPPRFADCRRRFADSFRHAGRDIMLISSLPATPRAIRLPSRQAAADTPARSIGYGYADTLRRCFIEITPPMPPPTFSQFR